MSEEKTDNTDQDAFKSQAEQKVSMSQKVIVLCPNGRRQTVPVTPNTSILNIQELVCTKQGLDMDVHRLVHHNKPLDPSSTVRFAGLTNQAQLELEDCEADTSTNVNVSVCLQLPDGQRLVDDFPNTSTLDLIQTRWAGKIGQPGQGEEPVMVYMRREVVGEELAQTTIRTLGLTHGKALFRFFFKKPETLKDQSNVSRVMSCPMKTKTPKLKMSKKDDLPMKSQSSQPQNIESTKPEPMEVAEPTTSNAPDAGPEPTPGPSAEMAYTAPDSSPYIKPIVNFIGPNNDAIVFSSALESPAFRDLDDDFFNLKITDVKVLHQTAVKHTDEGGALLTATTREAEEEGGKLALLGRYLHVVLRIQFSTGLVVQGVFSPSTSVQEVLDWLGPLLTHPAGGELYTAPPRTKLPPSSTLLDLGLLPAALVHFSSPSAHLTELATENLSNAAGANVEAAKYRKGKDKPETGLNDELPDRTSVVSSVMESSNVEDLQISSFSVLITGCNRGIGLELVKQFLRQDYPPDHLFATARNTKDAAELSELAASNENLHLLQLHVTNYEDYPQVVKEVSQIVGDEGLNLLINNAGVMPQNGDLESVTPEDMRNTFEVNCVAPLFLTRAMLPLIKQAAQKNAEKPIGIRKAAIIQMSSSRASLMNKSGGMYAYGCSKVALNMAMKSLSVDLAGTNILELSMHPDWVQTDMGGPNARISTEECCNTMINTLEGLTEKDHGTFLRYNNSPMPW